MNITDIINRKNIVVEGFKYLKTCVDHIYDMPHIIMATTLPICTRNLLFFMLQKYWFLSNVLHFEFISFFIQQNDCCFFRIYIFAEIIRTVFVVLNMSDGMIFVYFFVKLLKRLNYEDF